LCEIYNLNVVREFEIVMSGTDIQHTRAFHEMPSMLKRPEIAGIVVASLDRLFRVTKLSVLAVLRDFEDTGKFLFCDLGEMDLNNPNHMMMVSIKAQMAGMEKNLIRYRTLDARNEMRLILTLALIDCLAASKHERERDKVNGGRFRSRIMRTRKSSHHLNAFRLARP
jgi:DNA invertase Pin-like site-specific DNA recombinase